MLKKLTIITASLLFAGILNAETYACNIFVKEGVIKMTSDKDSSFVQHKISFDVEEATYYPFILARGENKYDFAFEVLTSHDIEILDYDKVLDCNFEKTFMSSGPLMKAECKSKIENDRVVFTADCQQLVW